MYGKKLLMTIVLIISIFGARADYFLYNILNTGETPNKGQSRNRSLVDYRENVLILKVTP